MLDDNEKNWINNLNYKIQLRNYRFLKNFTHKVSPYSFLDDRFFLQYKFLQLFGKKIKLGNPKSFNEKLQWLKLFDRNPLYTQLVDKFSVRAYVRKKIGDMYLNELLDVYISVKDIKWNELPNQFVMKTTHGCGQNIICYNKKDLNTKQAIINLSHWLGENNYERSREWPYKNVEPRIICEKYIPWDPKLGLIDYKVYCFNGKPTFIDVHYGRYTVHKSIFYNTKWVRQSFGLIPKETELDFLKPRKLPEMLSIAQSLSEGIPFCRIDLYYVDEKIYFGEVTFFPGGGFLPFHPFKYNKVIGELIELPERKLRLILCNL